MNGLEIGDLRAFVATVRAGSITRAATSLGLTQPAVSQRLARLERTLGTRLLERRTRGSRLTGGGESLLAHAERILVLHDEAFAACRAHSERATGPRTVAFLEDLAVTALPGVLADFATTHPDVDLDVVIDSAAALAGRDRDGALDMAVGDTAVMPAASVRWRTAMPLAWLGTPAVDVMRDPVPLVLFAPPCGWRQHVLDTLARHGRTWRIAFQSTSLGAVQAAVGAGIGVGALFPANTPAGCVRFDPPALPAVPPVDVVIARRPGTEADTALDTLERLLRHVLDG
ncbi:MAG TPA: LysR family transcriptional regulator [Pseudonocardiaceae bacterium]|nr:LysR family transcriptional regulator [Pseudonocardiaceae bacterium]